MSNVAARDAHNCQPPGGGLWPFVYDGATPIVGNIGGADHCSNLMQGMVRAARAEIEDIARVIVRHNLSDDLALAAYRWIDQVGQLIDLQRKMLKDALDQHLAGQFSADSSQHEAA